MAIPDWFQHMRWKVPEDRDGVTDRPQWDGSIQPDATLLVWHHYAYGDGFQFARYLKLAAARVGRVIADFDARQAPLMRFVPGVHEVSTWGQGSPVHDIQCCLFQLPELLTTLEDIPPPSLIHVSFPGATVPWLENFVSLPRPWVGVCWQGDRRNYLDPHRSFSPHFLSILANTGVTLISLQQNELITDHRIISWVLIIRRAPGWIRQ